MAVLASTIGRVTVCVTEETMLSFAGYCTDLVSTYAGTEASPYGAEPVEDYA